ncbi:MAG: glycosyltransferase family 2 protein [Lachnospiraceae bacterium]|nr:glycosyltransferase family 2 protein [Lachnospiraceae bacterium]
MDKNSVLLILVLPCYNEESALGQSIETLLAYFNELIADGEISEDSRLLLVDDGSADRTWEIIEEFHERNGRILGLKLSRNEGHQTAIYAGMADAIDRGAEVVITIDADLQQDMHAIPRFLSEYRRGCDIVYGVRSSRDTDSFFKRTTGSGYYRLMSLLGCELIPNSADYRLMSKRAVEALLKYEERDLFIRGIIPTMGYPTGKVVFDVKEREAGESKYTIWKMLHLAMDGITSFSIRPIRIVTILGFLILFMSGIMIIHVLWDYFHGNTVSGWSSILASLWFLGGVGIFSIGVVGEYVGRAYLEAKKRPRFFIEKKL